MHGHTYIKLNKILSEMYIDLQVKHPLLLSNFSET